MSTKSITLGTCCTTSNKLTHTRTGHCQNCGKEGTVGDINLNDIDIDQDLLGQSRR